jgi:phage tail-like protein
MILFRNFHYLKKLAKPMFHQLISLIMAKFNVNTHRQDPYKSFKFRVLWDGKVIPGISKVSGLNRVTEVVDYREGGDAGNIKTTPGTTVFEPVILERGVTHDQEFEKWANLVFSPEGDGGVSLKDYRKDIIIQLLNLQGVPVMAFFVYRCWVSAYRPLSELDAQGNCIATERLVLQHDGWERDQAVSEPQET